LNDDGRHSPLVRINLAQHGGFARTGCHMGEMQVVLLSPKIVGECRVLAGIRPGLRFSDDQMTDLKHWRHTLIAPAGAISEEAFNAIGFFGQAIRQVRVES
jgi:hypothetical protein